MADATGAAPAHQFDDLDQQLEADKLGMWAFLVTEVLFFGGMFTGYTVYRSMYPEAFAIGSAHLSYGIGTVNTAVLLLSSLTMALGVHATQVGRPRRTAAWLVATMVLGTLFLGLKGLEYAHKFEEHLVPGWRFELAGPHADQVEMFLGFYFVMTGMHAIHMLIGLGILAWLVRLALAGRLSAAYHFPVTIAGLYWHFVDIVWIFLYPLLYLVGAHLR